MESEERNGSRGRRDTGGWVFSHPHYSSECCSLGRVLSGRNALVLPVLQDRGSAVVRISSQPITCANSISTTASCQEPSHPHFFFL